MAAEYHEFIYGEGDSYKGQWNADGKRNGLGVVGRYLRSWLMGGQLKFADNSLYAGQFSNGMNAGYGVLTFVDKSKYEGQFVDGHYDGFGVFTKADGVKYEGEFRGGKGAGRVTFRDGTSGRPKQEGFFNEFKLERGGAQPDAIRKAADAAQQAQQAAAAAARLKA